MHATVRPGTQARQHWGVGGKAAGAEGPRRQVPHLQVPPLLVKGRMISLICMCCYPSRRYPAAAGLQGRGGLAGPAGVAPAAENPLCRRLFRGRPPGEQHAPLHLPVMNCAYFSCWHGGSLGCTTAPPSVRFVRRPAMCTAAIAACMGSGSHIGVRTAARSGGLCWLQGQFDKQRLQRANQFGEGTARARPPAASCPAPWPPCSPCKRRGAVRDTESWLRGHTCCRCHRDSAHCD